MLTTIILYGSLLGWIPFVVVLFALMPPQRAAALAVVGAWLVLPPAAIGIAGLPDISKSWVTTVGMMLGTLFFGLPYALRFRPRWFDLPMLLWCVTGIATSLQNGLGLYDGLADMAKQVLTWGLPYLFGRLYFSDLDGLRTLAITMIGGGLCYVLPCLWEIRMSPNLLRTFYGMLPPMEMRNGSYRPHVFFWTGLECGLWMTAASITAWWLWKCGTIRKIGRVPFGLALLSILIGTTVICRATGALALLFCGMMILWLSTRIRTRLILASFLFVGPVYVAIRVPNLWSGQQAVDLAESIVGKERAYSLNYRFVCENLLIARARQQPLLGWGGWGRSDAFFDANTPYRENGSNGWAVDHLLRDEGLGWLNLSLFDHGVARWLVCAAISTAIMGRRSCSTRVSRRSTAHLIHCRLFAQRLREPYLYHACRWTHGHRAKAPPASCTRKWQADS